MSTITKNPFLQIDPASSTTLAGKGRFSQAGHQWSAPQVDALTLAWAAQRPLLVRGEAGTGKSQIARAAAAAIEDAAGSHVTALAESLLVQVIHARFEATDLLWRIDVIKRLADAQPGSSLDKTNREYLKQGKMWMAIEAAKKHPQCRPVLLIDEIDKADVDVPNALLEVLGNRSFEGPPPDETIIHAEEGEMPLVIITTNEERELPAAFVRRCVVLNLDPPKQKHQFVEWLIDRGRTHDHISVSEEARQEAAEQVSADRDDCLKAGYPPVGLAEYVDLLSALHALTHDDAAADKSVSDVEWLRRLSVYALRKRANDDQTRPPVATSDESKPDAATEDS